MTSSLKARVNTNLIMSIYEIYVREWKMLNIIFINGSSIATNLLEN
jgi:hypothetical protein